MKDFNISNYRQKIKSHYCCWYNYGISILFILLLGSITPSFAIEDVEWVTLFKQEKYMQTANILEKELKSRPKDPELNYFMGRCLLAVNQADDAIYYLKIANRQLPDNPEYYFWLGIGYWANMEFEKEKQSYLKALKLDPDHLMANLYLGHTYMDKNKWKQALYQYDRVLIIDSGVPEALYNRALVFRHLKKKADEIKAWQSYLNHYRSGKWAIGAVQSLNRYGDFSYRLYLLGNRRIVVPVINFEQNSNDIKKDSLSAIGIIGEKLLIDMELSIHLIAYVNGNSKNAKTRANLIKRLILEAFPTIEASRIMVSWFGVSEKIDLDKTAIILEESINIFTAKN